LFSAAKAASRTKCCGAELIGLSHVSVTETPKAAGPKVNINTASQAELEGLPRIGPKIAEQIIQYRTQNGNFKKIEEIMKVKGIGEKLFNQLKDLITVSVEVK
jgi:competence protein ComEA